MSMLSMGKSPDILAVCGQLVRNLKLSGVERQSPSQNGKRPLDGCDTDALKQASTP
jgi:hypothetical protein